uniref:Contactin n=1 Tax=Aceria tosichella TaxID=561515 RepID=A0A6G1S8Q7_9ACAR
MKYYSKLLVSLLSVLLIVCSLSYATNGLTIKNECPKNWVSYSSSCYKFVRSNSSQFYNASNYCDLYNAKLISVNDFEENDFILDWLQDNDPYRRIWLTSALVSYGQNNWQWTGDLSKFINNNDLWLPTNASYERMSFNGAAYTFSYTFNKWGLIRVDNQRPVYSFICEFHNTNSAGNSYLDRGIDYGLNIHNKSLVPRGPRITVEPRDVVFDISGRSHSNQLKLRCVADAHPEPSYTWYREDHNSNGLLVGTPIDPLDDDRLTQTDGTLTIFNPKQETDKGKYYCAAMNVYGRVISQTVSITFGYILEFNKKRSIERGKENWGKSISCDAPQHHPRVLYYWTKAEFPNFVQEDRRVFISHDGNLYFSSLEKIDRSNYSCQIQSLISSTGRFGPSFPLVVEPASNGQKLQFANGFPKSFPEGPLAGDDIRLECMAYGYPTPAYNWTRVSPTQHMPRGYSLRNDGKVLVIPRARIEDEGEYVCKATSENESLQKSVRVSVQARPRFTQPLDDQVLGEREQLVWDCEAFGLPHVTYSWFKNGEELSLATMSPLDAARYTIKDNRFMIDSVQRERDSAMYQCRASNQYGSAFSSAQLRVMNLKPNADKDPMPLSVQAMVDQNITIPCYVEAIPKPVITWRKEGQQIEDRSRIKVTPSGLLQIARVRVSDAGGYECQAENHLGALSTKTWLVVKPAPIIAEPIQRREIARFGDTKTLSCEVQQSDSYNMEIAHVWLKNGLMINFDDPTTANKYSRTETGQLTIRNISYIDQANYTCQAQTSIGTVERSGTLLVRGPPDACGAVSADGLTQFSARVSWTDGSDHLAKIVFNTIEGRTNHNSSWTVLAANISAQLVQRNQYLHQPIPVSGGPLVVPPPAVGGGLTGFYRKTFLLQNQLMPWSIYEFRVSATNEFGQGPPSEPSAKYRTDMSAPRFAVSNLRGGGGKAGTLSIKWDPLPVYAWGSNEIWYQIYYRLNGTYEWSKRELTSAGGLTDAYTINVGSENFYKLFDVMVQPINSIGAGPLSQLAYIRSAQQMPWIQPNNVHGVAHNSTSLNVTWSFPTDLLMPDPESSESGKLVGYRIRYWPTGKDPQTHSLTKLKRGNETWGLVVGLQPDTEYHVSVMAYNEAGSGPESESFRLRTFKSAPQRAPTSVSAEFLDDTTIKVIWRGVAPITTNEEPVLGYKVRYWRYDEPISSAKDLIKPLGGDELSLVLSNLVPGETYKLRVLAYSSGGDGKMSSPELIIKIKSQPSES